MSPVPFHGTPQLWLCLLLALWAPTCNAQDFDSFLGDWSLNLESNEPAWMRIVEEDGSPIVFMRVYVGSAGPYPIAVAENEGLEFQIKPKRRKDKSVSVRRYVKVALADGQLVGTLRDVPTDHIPSTTVGFTGTRIPPMPAAAPDLSSIRFGEKVELFNGKDLSGWRTHESDKKNGWSVVDGELVNTTPKTDFSATGAFANLRTVDEFEDFRLHIEFLVEENRNSGIYLRGMYEAQVVDRDSRMQGIQGPGAIFGLIAPSKNAGKTGGQWQSYDLTLVNRHITVVLNGETVIDNQPATGPTAGAIYTNPSQPGPIYLQGDHTNVKYRNIILEPVLPPTQPRE